MAKRRRRGMPAGVKRTEKDPTWPNKDLLFTPQEFLGAVEDSRGSKGKIAKRLGCSIDTVNRYLLLEKKSWNRVRLAFDREAKVLPDEAEDAVRRAVRQSADVATSARTALHVLERLRPEKWGPRKQVVALEGGDPNKPVKVEQSGKVEVDVTKLTPEARKALLEQVERDSAPKED